MSKRDVRREFQAVYAASQAGIEFGVEQERERIIELLTERGFELAAQGGMTEAITMNFAIELIKGENNA